MSSANADAWSDLAERQKAFERSEFAKGRSPAGAGFAARLAAVYAENLEARARAIVDALKTVHQAFQSPVDDGIDAQLRDWGRQALSSAFQGLESGYVRHLRRFGIEPADARGFDLDYARAQAFVGSAPARYMWELRHVPAKRPTLPTASTAQLVINNSGTIGAVQTGPGALANVQQWVSGDTSELQSALAALRDALERAHEVETSQRAELIADVESAVIELRREVPNKGRLLRWLGGIGAVVQTTASVQPAFDAVKSLARALGIPL